MSGRLVLALLLVAALVAGRAQAAPSKGPVGADDFILEQVRLEVKDGAFLLVIPSQAPWSHWTLGNPARVIVDLGSTRSRLPNSPGLFEQVVNRGVVKTFRTSQHMNSPLDRRVRMTIELSRVVPYEARRVGSEIQILIPDAGAGSSWSTVIGQPGGSVPLPSVQPLQIPGATKPGPPEEPPANAHKEETSAAKAPEVAQEAAPPEETKDHAAAPPQAPQVSPFDFLKKLVTPKPKLRPPTTEEPAPAETKAAEVLQGMPQEGAAEKGAEEKAAPTAETHEGADAEAGGEGHPAPPSEAQGEAHAGPNADAKADASAGAKTDASTDVSAGANAHGRHAEASAPHEEARKEAEGTHPLPNRPARAESPSSHPEAKGLREALEAVVGAGNVSESGDERAGENASAPREAEHPEPRSDETDEAPEEDTAPIQSPEELHAARASILYTQALEQWLRGEDTRARTILNRVRRHYPDAEGARHAGFLLREMDHLSGAHAEADAIEDAPSAPDTSWFPEAAFEKLLDAYREARDYLEMDRMVAEWGPLYAPGEWAGQAHWTLGRAFLELEKTERAREHLEALEVDDPNEPMALLLLAQLAEDEGDPARALELYEILATRPTSVWQQRGLARAADLQFQHGAYPDSFERYEALLDGEPPPDEEVWALYQTGNCLLLLGDPEGARMRFQTLVQRWPTAFWATFARERLEVLAWNQKLAATLEATARP